MPFHVIIQDIFMKRFIEAKPIVVIDKSTEVGGRRQEISTEKRENMHRITDL